MCLINAISGTGIVFLRSFLILFLGVYHLGCFAADTGEAEKRGRYLYYNGVRSGGESITANIGAASIPVPASTITCVNCHGRDGKGRPEGGVVPSDIRWIKLSNPNGGESSVGREFGKYTLNRFLKAVTEGVDSSDNKLDPSMPRFNISKSDARDLIAYLKVIEDDFDPGITSDKIIIGTLQPETPPHAHVSAAMTSVIKAFFKDINRDGGVYGRKLELKTTGYKNDGGFLSMADELAGNEQVFALLNVFSAHADKDLVTIVENNRIPSFAPFTQFPSANNNQFHYTFYLDGGLDSQLRVLLNRALETLPKKGKVFLVHRDASNINRVIDNVMVDYEKHKKNKLLLTSYKPGTNQSVSGIIKRKITGNDVLVFAGLPSDFIKMIKDDSGIDKIKSISLPGYFVTRDVMHLPAPVINKLELAYVTVPGQIKNKTLLEFRDFMTRHKLKYDYMPMRIFAYNAVRTMVHALKLSGKRINRDVFITSLEGLHSFDLGTTAPLRYGSQRRVGLTGSQIVKMNPQNRKLEPVGKWVKLD